MIAHRAAAGPIITPSRERLLGAAKAARMPLKELSLAIGRNHSYLQQFIMRGTPKVLPEAEREAIAAILRIPADDLRDMDRPRPIAPSEAPYTPPPQATRRLPLVIQGHEQEHARTIALREMVGEDCSPEAWVLRLSRPLGVFQPRTMLLLDPAVSVRVGDFAALLDEGVCQGVGIAALEREGRPAVHLPDASTLEATTATAKLVRVECIRPA
jgi:hypothetical protein